MTTTVKQIEFAALLGVSRSYITKLKADGRLIMDGDRVDVEASRARIADTADPHRDDVASRWAERRDRAATAAAIALPLDDEDDLPEDPPATSALRSASSSYVDARARKEQAQADIAEMERDKTRGLLIERQAVEAAVEDVMTTVRQALEQQPHRLAPLLVGQDLDAIRITLKQETARILGEMVHTFAKRLRQIAGEEEKEPVA
jgi:phage terminase Nu1 subunit (DNA packaging protein)